MVLDECHKQIADASGKQQGKIDELNSEIRKLKAMIGELFPFPSPSARSLTNTNSTGLTTNLICS
jgi:hypothetical protein